ncbi:hypothetical protein K432DRAFT_122442 [Lepidopterella palustris CBS 459.81]|uniref:Uncharacterized protein n=1 Tax=Lepidopterella palustris CBS 459.81 TaxID=1314670 RepID=A0A8E2JCV0_9PEZI|nr:hypothetical protein K432DRAFT_122442 [Lepidopterella palustris CBS 459.81]
MQREDANSISTLRHLPLRVVLVVAGKVYLCQAVRFVFHLAAMWCPHGRQSRTDGTGDAYDPVFQAAKCANGNIWASTWPTPGYQSLPNKQLALRK